MEEFRERLVKVESRAASNTHRIDALEKINALISEQNANMARMIIQLEHIQETQDEHSNRITVLEKRPASLWDKVVFGIIGAVAAALAAGVLATFLK